jgi:hypothetical protein
MITTERSVISNKYKDSASATFTPAGINVLKSKLGCMLAGFGGVLEATCLDASGNVKWSEKKHNIMTDEGLNHILDVVLHATTQVTTWYVGLALTGTKAAGDTLASHAGWTEFTSYTGNRVAYNEAAAATKVTTNSASPASFAINGAGTVYGAFLASAASGTTGTLLAAVDFSGSRVVANLDTLNVTYQITAADS